MKITIKLLTIALILTAATQSFGMWSRAARFFSAARASVATRVAPIKAAMPNWTSRINVARSNFARWTAQRFAARPPVGRFGAPRMLYAGAASTALVSASVGATSAVATSKSVEAVNDTMRTLQEGSRAPQREWTEGAMQAKLDELRAVEHLARTQITFEGDLEGTYVAKSDDAKKSIAFVRENADAFAKCLAREATHQDDTESEKAKAECAKCSDLLKK